MIQFYSPDILTTLQLPESDSRHAIRVLRMNLGDTLQVIDGRGNIYTCRIVDPHPKHAAIEILDTTVATLPWTQNITLAVAPTKNLDRIEWLVEKLTEIGINRIIPILCQRSERRELKTERLEKIAVSAMKQSLKATLPQIDPLTPIREILPLMPEAQRYIAHCASWEQRTDLATIYTPHRDTLILIGPEGDFSPAEIEATLTAGYTPVTLGDNRLRTETAALYAVTALHVLDSANPL